MLDNYSFWLRNQTGNLSFKPKKNNLNSIVEEVFKEHQIFAAKKKIGLNYLPVLSTICYADENMLKIILNNLIHNSIKFTNPGGKVDVDAVILQDKIKIIVTDNGIGINEITRNKLFHIKNESNGEEGFGLGLVLCKAFVEKHGGKIWYDSMPDEGATFFFTMPIERDEGNYLI